MACANGYLDIVKFLLLSNANPNHPNESKNTPLRMKYLNNVLDWAALNGRKEVVELLLESKADPNIKNEFDRIPLEDAL
jgi:ankyrin repeat protein